MSVGEQRAGMKSHVVAVVTVAAAVVTAAYVFQCIDAILVWCVTALRFKIEPLFENAQGSGSSHGCGGGGRGN